MKPASPALPGRKNIFDLLNQPQAAHQLPSLRNILRDLEEKTSYQQVPIQEISKLIRTDQSLSVRILRLANSGYFSLGQPVVDLDEAILYLGLNNVRTVVFTSRCIETTAALDPALFSWGEYWKHSAGVAAITKLLAQNLRRELQPLPAESYYLMGLLHDIGKLVLAMVMPREFAAAVEAARARPAPLPAMELEFIGADHAQVGGWYLQRQGVPAALSEAVRLHHHWRLDTSRLRTAFLLHTADCLARHLGIGQSGNAEPVTENPLQSPAWQEFTARYWEPVEDPSNAHREMEEELNRLPELVQSITA